MNKLGQELAYKIRNIEGWLTSHEGLFLLNAAKSVISEGEIVEIGSWKGKSTIYLAYGHRLSGQRGYVWAIDPHQGAIKSSDNNTRSTLSEFTRNIQSAGVKDIVKPIVNTSIGAVKKWSKPIRLLFIDGLHDYEHAREDYLAWNKFVVPDGIIAFHDGFCGIIGVGRAIEDTIFTRPDLVDLGTVSSILYGVVGIPNYWQKIRVKVKLGLVRFANKLNQNHPTPGNFNFFLIHRIIRLLLINSYTIKVYFSS
jgi:predicted O-methyltransferase YrrM